MPTTRTRTDLAAKAQEAEDRAEKALIYLRVSSSGQADTDYDAEGNSIPAQRGSCERKAQELSAVVVDQFVDRAESAKTANRPGLQAMLARLKRGDIDYVIVHKIDRLARSRADDVAIVAAIQASGARLVSVSENIDDTPAGVLLHGVMSSISEFYSRNLAAEVTKGLVQKAKAGGTPTLAPVGYLNVRERIDGREIRTVTVDPERAPHVVAMFDIYATGRYSLADLATILEDRGLRSRETRKMASRPLTRKQIQKALTNPYYLGKVRYAGKIYDGRHKPLISEDLFERVQRTLEARRLSGERDRVHQHYLKGTIYCAECGARLMFSRNKGRHGGAYDYFLCRGKQIGACSQPYHRLNAVEKAVAALYRDIHLSEREKEIVRLSVEEHAGEMGRASAAESAAAAKALERLGRQERKLLSAHYADEISDDLFREENQRIRRERIAAETLIRERATETTEILAALDDMYHLMENVYST